MLDTFQTRAGPYDKIVSFDELTRIRQRLADKKIIHCHGAFDLVHIGHLVHFEEAKALGDVLVVTITGDQHITKKRAVTFDEKSRAWQLASLEIVDYVVIVHEPTVLTAIAALQPDVYVKGPEYADLTLDKSRSIYHEMQLLKTYGGRIHFTSGETYSSTKLSHFLLAAPEAAQRNPLLQNDRVRFRDVSAHGFRLEQLKHFLAKAHPLRVCVLGETIIDEWVDVALTTLSTQSRCVAGDEVARVRQVGGAGIVALHLANFVSEVDCFTNGLADAPANVHVTNLTPGELIETRFVDRDTGHPVFKSRTVDLSNIASHAIADFDAYDVVLIADFGHGLLDPSLVNHRIADHRAATVAAMVQVNSSNYGFNLPIKYVGADYYSLNRTEAELCLHERNLPATELVRRSAALLGSDALSVTDGLHGVATKVGAELYELPSLSVSVVDTIGCGDAYFALSTLAVRLGLPPSQVALVGSIGAAAMTQRRCNESPVTEQDFLTIGKIVI
ncbi:MAG TPA: PfkB family carbohydrate kinase [Vicinamibacterales bacterium]|nr:PfkB family carbohydrate kinase [Vicinamibacterales bacterium]